MKYFLSILLFADYVTQGQVFDVSEWNISDLPPKDSIEFYRNSEQIWHLANQGGKILASEDEEKFEGSQETIVPDSVIMKVFRMFPAGNRTFINTKDGVLIGVHNGPYRGGLFWISSDFKRGYQITSQKILKFVGVNDRVFAIEDFPNLGISKGNVIEVTGSGEKLSANNFYEMSVAPIDIVRGSLRSMIIITDVKGQLIELSEENGATILIEGGMWEGMGPTGLVAYKDDIYIAMKKGVLLYHKKTKKQEWLTPITKNN